MNANTNLQKYVDRFNDGTESGAGSDAEENLGAFGLLRGTRDRADFLELKKKSGDIRAVGYGWIENVDFDPSPACITLHFNAGRTVKIKGRNLNAVTRQQLSLLGGILRLRVLWIVESDQSTTFQADKDVVVVETIEW
jgi:hypothetical protein